MVKPGLVGAYDKLFSHYGPQRWWPTRQNTGLRRQERQQSASGALSSDEQFEIIAGAILTQNTSWKNAGKAINNLALGGVLSPDAIQRARESELAEMIRPAGYYNQKAERLKLFARALANWRSEPTREALLSITGIGPETADSILLYAYGRPCFVIDAYTRRLLSRLGIAREDAPYEELQRLFHKEIPPAEKNIQAYKEFHALIVRLCKDFCRKEPVCSGCPLGEICGFYKK